jgi:predicted DNA-binding ribbon-helix-helix protein
MDYTREPRTMVVSIRFTVKEWRELFTIAKKEKLSVADIIRRKLFLNKEA